MSPQNTVMSPQNNVMSPTLNNAVQRAYNYSPPYFLHNSRIIIHQHLLGLIHHSFKCSK